MTLLGAILVSAGIASLWGYSVGRRDGWQAHRDGKAQRVRWWLGE